MLWRFFAYNRNDFIGISELYTKIIEAGNLKIGEKGQKGTK